MVPLYFVAFSFSFVVSEMTCYPHPPTPPHTPTPTPFFHCVPLPSFLCGEYHLSLSLQYTKYPPRGPSAGSLHTARGTLSLQ
jgi:hypothetical protein